MPNITAPALTVPSKAFPGQQAGAPSGVIGELVQSAVLGRYATLVKAQKVYYVSAIVTSPVIFSTAAGQLGPMIWNKPGSGLDVHMLAFSVSQPTTQQTSTISGTIGFATNNQTTAPTTPGTTLIPVNAYAGGGGTAMSVTAGGVPIVLPAPVFWPLIGSNGGAITTQILSTGWVDLCGAPIVGPGNVIYVAPDITMTSGVFRFGLLWAELPV